jgi:hypothetical protein|tara:strand:+ start:1689 stop:3008 length:1320 start_codon:yes stop_codon:yes gene_type:complete
MANTYLTSNIGSPNQQKFTWSVWVKRSALGIEQHIAGNYNSGNRSHLFFHDSDSLRFYSELSSSLVIFYNTTRLFRDTSAWYNIVLAVDTTAAGGDRVKFFINGVRETSFANSTECNQNTNLSIGTTHYIGTYGGNAGSSTYTFNGSMSHVHFSDGYCYDESDFGSTDSTTGEWQINTGPNISYGSSGYFILKDGNTVTDQSGNSNNFTINVGSGGGLNKTEDCPSNNFATFNSLAQTLSGITYSYGNNVASMTSDAGQRQSISTLGMPSGKFYAEFRLQAIGSTGGSYPYVGIVAQEKYDADMYVGGNGTGWHPTGDIYNGGSNSGSGSTYTTGDIIGVAVDIDNSKLYWHKNGTYIMSGNPTTGSNGYDISSRTAEGVLGFGVSHWNNNGVWQANFGNGYFANNPISSAGTNASGIGIFEYDVPAGFTALSTKGLNE